MQKHVPRTLGPQDNRDTVMTLVPVSHLIITTLWETAVLYFETRVEGSSALHKDPL